MLTKTCISCFEDFPKTKDFFYSKGGKRLRAECKKCWNRAMKKQYKARWFMVKKVNDRNRKSKQEKCVISSDEKTP